MTGAWTSLLAALEIDFPKQNRSMGKMPGLFLSDILLIVGVGLGLVLILAAIIYLWMRLRKRRKHVSGGEKVYRNGGESPAVPTAESPSAEDDSNPDDDDASAGHGGRRRYKYRVRRRTHRTRNPTLSETGGLPPVKSQEPGKPC